MALYDGNQLPENPTSNFQLFVSLMYTLMMTFYMSMGAFAAWASQKRLAHAPYEAGAADGCACAAAGQLQHPTHYMSDLVHKRNAICRGLLTFIPATYSLVHLYTNSLHSSSMYSAGNVVFAALLGYSAFFVGKTLQQLVADSDHMDTTKAVYESLYMLSSAYDRLRLHEPRAGAGIGIFTAIHQAQTPAANTSRCFPAWRKPWVLFNVFLALAAQDDARIWPMFSIWLRRFQLSSLTVLLPAAATMRSEVWELLLWPAWVKMLASYPASCLDFKHQKWLTNTSFAYWLYSQDQSVRTITGSLVHQGIANEMPLAGYRSDQLYYTALAYISALTAHVVDNLNQIKSLDITFTSKIGTEVTLGDLAEVLSRIFHAKQANKLSMTCERYVCRLTPAFAALCLPTNTLLPRMFDCWEALFSPGAAAILATPFSGPALPGTYSRQLLQSALNDDPGYWCRLWLGYMHVVLLGVDLLRMHNNKPYLKDAKGEAGMFRILEAKKEPSSAELAKRLLDAQPVDEPPSPAVNGAALDLDIWRQLATTASAAVAVATSDAVRGEAGIEYSTVHDLSDADLYTLAAFAATLLLRYRMLQEGALVLPVPLLEAGELQAATALSHQVKLCDVTSCRTTLVKAGYPPSTYGDYLYQRRQLVSSHSSLPAIVEGVECVPAADWVLGVMTPLMIWLAFAALAAAINATIACSNGVFLVAVSGAVQAMGTWALLLQLDQLPVRQVLPAGSAYGAIFFMGRMLYLLWFVFAWLCELVLRPLWIFAQVLALLSTPVCWFYWFWQCCHRKVAEDIAVSIEAWLHYGVAVRLMKKVVEPHMAIADEENPPWGDPTTQPKQGDVRWKLPSLLWLVLFTVLCAFWYAGRWSGEGLWWASLTVWLLTVFCMLMTWLLTWGPTGDVAMVQWALWAVWLFATTTPCLIWVAYKGADWVELAKSGFPGQAAGWWILWSVCMLFTTTPWVVWCCVCAVLTVLFALAGWLLQWWCWAWLEIPIPRWFRLGWFRLVLHGHRQHPSTPYWSQEAATTLAAAASAAATATRAVEAAKEAYAAEQVEDITAGEQLKRWSKWSDTITKDAVGDISVAPWRPGQSYDNVTSVLDGAMAVEEIAIKECAAECIEDIPAGPGQPFHSKSSPLNPVRDPPDGATTLSQKMFTTLSKVRANATGLLLILTRARISLVSCFEKDCRHFYKDRVKPWNAATKVIPALFFYAFILFVGLAYWQEPFYAGRGMCTGRCFNRTDCQAEQNIGLVGADNAFGRWVTPEEMKSSEVKSRLKNDPPECPGAGVVTMPDDHRKCAWLGQLMHVNVSDPAFFSASQNGTMCKAEVLLLNAHTNLPPAIGTPVPAVWSSMTNGRNDNYSMQSGERVTGYTNASGWANISSPLGKPFNSSGCHGCNLTVPAHEITNFTVAAGSVLNKSKSWGCMDCVGVWVPERPEDAPCDALCESYGNRTQTFHILIPGTVNGSKCEVEDGHVRNTTCRNELFCNCTGVWQVSKACDAPCQQWGTKTWTYHISKPAMSRWVKGKLVAGADCEAKDQQTKEERCFNEQNCTLELHADVYAKSAPGQGVHGDLVLTQHPRP